MRNDGGDVSGAFARVLRAFARVLRRARGVSESFLMSAEGQRPAAARSTSMITLAEMADLMLDELYVIAACYASCCTRLERVQRRAARARVSASVHVLHALGLCTSYVVAVLRVLLLIMQQSMLRAVGHTADQNACAG